MLDRLRPRPFVRRNDQQQQFHPRGTRQHVVQEALVARDVDDPRLDAVVETQVRETEIERHPAQLLLEPAIRIGAGERLDERRFSVIDVSGGS